MKCLLCDIPIQQTTWAALLTLQTDVICSTCELLFQRIDSSPERSYFTGTSLEGILDSMHCMYLYNEPMQSYIHRYKFLEDHALSQVFAKDFKLKGFIVPIPIFSGQQSRSYSPVEEWLPKNQLLHLLRKTTPSKQSSRTLVERLESDLPFEWDHKIDFPEEVWLVDDIYTSGTTMHQAAWVLKQNGIKRVHGLCLAEVQS